MNGGLQINMVSVTLNEIVWNPAPMVVRKRLLPLVIAHLGGLEDTVSYQQWEYFSESNVEQIRPASKDRGYTFLTSEATDVPLDVKLDELKSEYKEQGLRIDRFFAFNDKNIAGIYWRKV